MCNAYNHSYSCPCGFGGDTGGGGPRAVAAARWYAEEVLERPMSAGWAKDSSGTVESYVNPNAHCPVCGKLVYFYRSPYNGRVFFDDLGWPWPKHGCTDNGREPRRVTRDSAPTPPLRLVPQWRLNGWRPLLSAKAHADAFGRRLTGDLDETFVELLVTNDEKIDMNGPLLVRERDATPFVFEMTFLHSTRFGIDERTAFAFDPRIASLGESTLSAAARGDASALYELGAFILWKLSDPVRAMPYLERAGAGRIFDALVDLAVLRLLGM